MKLDLSVLEEVRRELETSQDISARPLLTKIRNLTNRHLAGLKLLCACDGHADIEQIWALEFIFNGTSKWTRESLAKN